MCMCDLVVCCFGDTSLYNVTVSVQFLDETADNLDGLPLKLHDFGMRGSTSVEVVLEPHSHALCQSHSHTFT